MRVCSVTLEGDGTYFLKQKKWRRTTYIYLQARPNEDKPMILSASRFHKRGEENPMYTFREFLLYLKFVFNLERLVSSQESSGNCEEYLRIRIFTKIWVELVIERFVSLGDRVSIH